jgi:GAF domain-containing protein
MRSTLDAVRAAFQAGELSRSEAAVRISAAACAILRVPLTSLWQLQVRASGPVLARIGGYDAVLAQPLVEPLELEGRVVRDYLGALRGGVFACDGLEPGATAAGWPGHVLPGSFRSLLDAVVGINGVILGLLCCEQRGGERRAWTTSDMALARALANEIAVAASRLQREASSREVLDGVVSDALAQGATGFGATGAGASGGGRQRPPALFS